MRAVARLVDFLMRTYGDSDSTPRIRRKVVSDGIEYRGDVRTHSEIAPGRKFDPVGFFRKEIMEAPANGGYSYSFEHFIYRAVADRSTPPRLAYFTNTSPAVIWQSPTFLPGQAFGIAGAPVSGHEVREPSWSSRDWIAFYYGINQAHGLFMASADGTQLIELEGRTGSWSCDREGTDERDPSWSPDGRFLVYSCVTSGGSYDIWVRDLVSTPTTTSPSIPATISLTS